MEASIRKKQKQLIPAIIQEDKTGEILMLGYMNQNALERTCQSGYVYFWSRKRKKLWRKGETSGNKLEVKNICIDCDNDALLITVKLLWSNVCHTGRKSCFQKFL